ncbi:hypothetical protein D2T29_12750 [Sinirhodobacter populi]|uniref:Uncharacterized protein n=1 Tax=Paenirhodobacter populi TaxID=2306993 RepID=A0A443KCL7_9RHOB|nr:hypothetical protein [Sinirhodobacter populi]RWR30534.1 hypothetical protein D2T29_12750 [Sinirhodobacter populi]
MDMDRIPATPSVFDHDIISTGISCSDDMTATLQRGIVLGYLVAIGRRDLADRALATYDDLRIARAARDAQDNADPLSGLFFDHTTPETMARMKRVDQCLAALRAINAEIRLAV